MNLEYKELQDSRNRLRQENIELREIAKVMASECVKLRHDYLELETQHKILENYYEEMVAERSDLLKKIEALNSQISELKRGVGEH